MGQMKEPLGAVWGKQPGWRYRNEIYFAAMWDRKGIAVNYRDPTLIKKANYFGIHKIEECYLISMAWECLI